MRIFKKKQSQAGMSTPRGPAGARAYAIGDIHGRLDLLRDLLGQIEADSDRHPCDREFVVFLGDLIDRGPDSRGVIELLRKCKKTLPNPIFIMGNHEEMMLRVLGGEPDRIWDWLSFGGYEFAQSYGVSVGGLATLAAEEAAAEIRKSIPPADITFVKSFADSFRFGDYLFVHAGIRPGVALEQQKVADLRWIRDDFLESAAKHPFFVIHGHTITARPDEQDNRIGIDTGAYASGVLTALCLEGTTKRYLSTAG